MKPNGTAIRAIRTARNMSLRQLARLTGRDRGHLSRIERGHIAASANETVQRIAEALQVPPDAITHKETQ